MGTFSQIDLGKCRQCGAVVRWATTEAGKQQPLDPEPDADGSVVARLGEGPGWWARVPSAERPQSPVERRFMPHAATCHARRLPAAPRPVPRPARPRPTPQAQQEALLPLHAVRPLPRGVASLDEHRARKEDT